MRSFTKLDIGNDAIANINISRGDFFIEEPGLLIDSKDSIIFDYDMYFIKKRIQELDICLNYLHGYSTKLLRSIITNKLHEAMDPIKL